MPTDTTISRPSRTDRFGLMMSCLDKRKDVAHIDMVGGHIYAEQLQVAICVLRPARSAEVRSLLVKHSASSWVSRQAAQACVLQCKPAGCEVNSSAVSAKGQQRDLQTARLFTCF